MAKLGNCLALAALGVAPLGAATAKSDDDAAAPHRRIQLGTCRVGADVSSAETLGLDLCLKARAGAEISYFFANPEDNHWLRYGRGYAGLHPTTWLSLHAAGLVRDLRPLGAEAVEDRAAFPEYALVRLGNPAFHRVRLTAGRLTLPFGVDGSEVMESVRWLENREFWTSPRLGAYLTADDRLATTVELGFASDQWSKDDERDRVTEDGRDTVQRPNQAYALRLSRDVSILDGSRLMASGYGDQNGRRRFGAAFVTKTVQGDSTHFEFVRILTTPSGKAAPFRQILRASYSSTWRANARWIVQIDDEQRRYRLGVLGYDNRILPQAVIRMAITYNKSETGDGERRWSLTTGLEAQL
jgi:hypothetical protein